MLVPLIHVQTNGNKQKGIQSVKIKGQGEKSEDSSCQALIINAPYSYLIN